MTKDELTQRKMQARQEREFHLQQAGIALGIETECDRLITEISSEICTPEEIDKLIDNQSLRVRALQKRDPKTSP